MVYFLHTAVLFYCHMPHTHLYYPHHGPALLLPTTLHFYPATYCRLPACPANLAGVHSACSIPEVGAERKSCLSTSPEPIWETGALISGLPLLCLLSSSWRARGRRCLCASRHGLLDLLPGAHLRELCAAALHGA